MTSPRTSLPTRPVRASLDDEVARAVIRARVRRQHRRAARVLTRA